MAARSLLSEALRPAAATDRWRQSLAAANAAGALARAMDTVTVIEAANVEEEALAIAVALREALDVPQRTAALVTPDRALARRVAGHARTLERHRPTIPAAIRSRETAAGVFARLVADAALERLAPVKLLALLKHPLARLGARARRPSCGGRDAGAGDPARAAAARRLARVWRGRWRPSGSSLRSSAPAKLPPFIAPSRAPRSRMRRSIARACCIDRVAAALAPLERMASRGEQDFAALAACHREAVVEREPRCRRHARGVRRHRRRGARRRLRRHRREGRAVHGRGGRLCGAVRRRHRRPRGAPARRAGEPRAHLRPARSAPDQRRSRRHRRPRRGRLAARSAHRSLAQPADAPCARPRSAGAAHRPFGARFRAADRRGGGVSHARGQGRGNADGRVAISPAPRRGGGRRRVASRGGRAASATAPSAAASTSPRRRPGR